MANVKRYFYLRLYGLDETIIRQRCLTVVTLWEVNKTISQWRKLYGKAFDRCKIEVEKGEYCGKMLSEFKKIYTPDELGIEMINKDCNWWTGNAKREKHKDAPGVGGKARKVPVVHNWKYY